MILCLSACVKKDFYQNKNVEVEELDDSKKNEKKKSIQVNCSVVLEKVPFSLKVQQNQFVTVCDILNSRILGYVWHWNDSGTFALMDQIFIWNMEKQKIEKTVTMNQEYLFSAVLDCDGGIYVGCADVKECEGEKWKLLYCRSKENKFVCLKNGMSSLLSGWGSPWLTHVGKNIVAVYEEKNRNDKNQIGCIKVNDGDIQELTDIKWDEDVKYISGRVAAAEENFAYLVERKDGSFIRLVNMDGEVMEFPWENKGYDFVIIGDYLIQSGQGEGEGEHVLHMHDIETGDEEKYRIKGHGFRMTPVGENSFFSVDSFFNIYYTKIENGKVKESYIDIPTKLKKRSVRFLVDEMNNIFFVYEDIPQSDSVIEIYKCKIKNEKN